MNKRYNDRGEWTHTVEGQPVIDNVPLTHECKGASDYCMHCGIDMCGPRGYEPCKGLEQARRHQIKPETVTAFGCKREAESGDAPCKQWCQGLNCAYTRAPAEQPTDTQKPDSDSAHPVGAPATPLRSDSAFGAGCATSAVSPDQSAS